MRLQRKTPQKKIEGKHSINSNQTKTNTTKLSAAITLRMSVTKDQTITFIMNGSD
jgi:hypothetical protein